MGQDFQGCTSVLPERRSLIRDRNKLKRLLAGLHCEANFNRDLVMPDRTIFDVTADRSDLDPPQIPQCLAGFANGFLDCIFNALR